MRQWFTVEFPYDNVGIVHGQHSNTVAIDCDGDVGADTIRELELSLGALLATPTILTGGGVQFIFRWPTGYDYIATKRTAARPRCPRYRRLLRGPAVAPCVRAEIPVGLRRSR